MNMMNQYYPIIIIKQESDLIPNPLLIKETKIHHQGKKKLILKY